MIYLHEKMTPMDFAKAREWQFVEWICEATGHVAATRIRTQRTVCLCGRWSYPVKEDGDDGIVSQVTVDALRAEIDVKNKRMTDLYLALERAVEELRELGSAGLATDLQDILEGKVQ